MRENSPTQEFDPQTVQPVGSRYTDYATWPTQNSIGNVLASGNERFFVNKAGVLLRIESFAICLMGSVSGHVMSFNVIALAGGCLVVFVHQECCFTNHIGRGRML